MKQSRPDPAEALSPRKLKQMAHLIERLEYLREAHPKFARAVEQLIQIIADGDK